MSHLSKLIEKLREIAYTAIEKALDRNIYEWGQIKKMVSDAMSRYIYQVTHRRPMILPIILDA